MRKDININITLSKFREVLHEHVKEPKNGSSKVILSEFLEHELIEVSTYIEERDYKIFSQAQIIKRLEGRVERGESETRVNVGLTERVRRLEELLGE